MKIKIKSDKVEPEVLVISKIGSSLLKFSIFSGGL